MVFLPFYLPTSSLLANKTLGLTAAALWVATQALWLQQGFQLEFLGNSTFVPGLWISSLLFFLTNAWLLGIIVSDIGSTKSKSKSKSHVK
jgi:GPI mannosyltransferase 1 subunit M